MEIACVHRSINKSINRWLLENWFCLAFFASIVDKMFPKKCQFLMTSYFIIIHHASLIFTIMQIKSRLLIHIHNYANSTWPLTSPKWPLTPMNIHRFYRSITSYPLFKKSIKMGRYKRIKLLIGSWTLLMKHFSAILINVFLRLLRDVNLSHGFQVILNVWVLRNKRLITKLSVLTVMSTGMLIVLWIISSRMQKSGPIIPIGKPNLPKMTILRVSGLLCEPNVLNLTPYLLWLMTIKLQILLILLMVLTNYSQVTLQILIRSGR